MKILHVVSGLTVERGGPSVALTNLADRQAAAGHMVAVLTTDQGTRHGERLLSFSQPVDFHQVRVLGPDRIAFSPRFVDVCRRLLYGVDIVHIHEVFTYPVHAALREALKVGVPVVLKPCGQLHRHCLKRSAWKKAPYLRLAGKPLRRVSAWHYCSAQEAAESWPWEDISHFVLPEGVNPDELGVDKREARRVVVENWPTLADVPYVLFLGRLHPMKRVDLLLEAFLKAAPGSFKLVIAGPDEVKMWPRVIDRFLSDPIARGRVVRIPTVHGELKASLFAAANVFAMPSDFESFGIAALEALAAGTPVLFSPHVDLGVRAAAAGWGTIATDLAAWKHSMATLPQDIASDSAKAETMRSWVAEHYSWKKLSQDLECCYRELLDGKTQPSTAADQSSK